MQRLIHNTVQLKESPIIWHNNGKDRIFKTQNIKFPNLYKHPLKYVLNHKKKLTRFLVTMKEQGYTNSTDDHIQWDDTSNYKFIITGKSNSEYAKDPSLISINSRATCLNGVLIRIFCKIMPIVALSTTES